MTANLFTHILNFAFSYHNTEAIDLQLHCDIFGPKSILMLYLTSNILLYLRKYIEIFICFC